MTLVRILDEDCSEELQALLKAAPDAPPIPEHVHERLQNYAIGLAAGVATTAAIGAGSAQAGLLGKAVSAVLATPLATKFVLGTVLFAATTTMGFFASGPAVEQLRGAPVATPRSAPAAQIHAVSAPPAVTEVRAKEVVEEVSDAVSAPRAAVARSITASSTETPVAGVAEEARMLELARAALVSRPAEALAIADEHAVRFPRGQLGAEREFIAIDALLRLGRKVEAARRAEPRLRQAPDSLYARRLRQLLGREE